MLIHFIPLVETTETTTYKKQSTINCKRRRRRRRQSTNMDIVDNNEQEITDTIIDDNSDEEIDLIDKYASDEVNIVFHSAATVNFTGIFEKFIQQNIDGTNSMLQLCQKMIHLQSIVYVSTAYGN